MAGRDDLGQALDQMEEGERLDIFEAALGRQVETALTHPPLKLLLERACEEIVQARNDLETVTPDDPNLIRQIQNRAKVGRLFIQSVTDAIIQGVSADERIALRDADNE
jgi:hypothetical protein